MKKYKKFGPGDKVFAKVRGYPPWPARIVGVADESTQVSRMKYHIYFYGTGETAVVKAEDVFTYVDHRNGKFGKPRKLKGFNEALEQIESELSPEEKAQIGNVSHNDTAESSMLSEDGSTPGRRPSLVEKESKQTPSTEPSEEKMDTASSDIVSSASDAPDLKTPKSRKRKSEMPEPPSESKKLKVTSPPVKTESPVSEDNLNKLQSDVTSRSGRKIKPKKFSDFDEVLEDDTLKNAKTSLKGDRSKGQSKNDDKSTEDELIFTHNNETVKIPLNSNRPVFKNHKSSANWAKLVQSQAENLKTKIVSGEIEPDQVNKMMEEFTREKIGEKRKEYEEDDRAFAILHVEGRLLQLDLKIKSALALSKSEPEECLKCMEEFASLPITALMLKKNPEVVETFKRLRRYVGNTAVWDMTDDELKDFNNQAQSIRSKADHIFNKMKGLFTVPEGRTFWSVFTTQLVDFNKVTKKLSQEDFYAIVEDPV